MRAALAIALVLDAWVALACGNSMRFDWETSPARALVADAERQVARGRPDVALALIRRAAGLESDTEPLPRHRLGPLLTDRAYRVQAVANLRTGRAGAALYRLKMMHRQNPADPYLRARLAEALLATGDASPQAGQLLEALAARDLMPDAQGWAALATARERAGNAAGRDAALARCRGVAPSASTCVVAPHPEPAPATAVARVPRS